MNKILSFSVILGLLPIFINAQYCVTTDKFTWEGDTIGNKAVWMVDDVLNTYTIGNTQIKVSISDPFGVNTTTLNPSDQNDYTKSNAYYGPGSLMLQTNSSTSNQAVCLRYEFSNPVILQNFYVYDIDYIGRGRPESSFQDSLSFSAVMNGRNVPLTLQTMSAFPTYIIYGQSVRSKYTVNVNGDINHFDVRGAVRVSSGNVAVSSFTLCHANGSQDDGLSNSHAVRIPDFDFCVAGMGTVSGKVKNLSGTETYSGSTIQLFDTLGFPVNNKNGQPLVLTTSADGFYLFDSIPYGIYDVVQLNDPSGSSSVDDADGGNDNKIRVILDVANPNGINKDFIEYFAPLPVRFGTISSSWENDGEVLIEWNTYSEINNHYFTLYISEDGKNFQPVGKVYAQGSGNDENRYKYLHSPGKGGIFYYKLEQTDFDGKSTYLGVTQIRRHDTVKNVSVFPNPGSDYIRLSGLEKENQTTFVIFDALGKMIEKGNVHQEMIPVAHIAPGAYFIRFTYENGQQISLPFYKK